MPAALSQGSFVSAPAMRLGVWNVRTNTARQRVEGAAMSGDAGASWLAEWHLQRNCALTPRQLLMAYGLACALALTVASGLYWLGASFVLPFALLELAVLGGALLAYARHATDREFIGLNDQTLRVERLRAGRLESVDFNPRWVRIEPQQHDLSLIRVSGQGHAINVGQHVQPLWRRQLANEFRWALRQLGSPATD